MIKEISRTECHYYQFTCNGEEGPQLQVTQGSIHYKVKEGAADQPGQIISDDTASASVVSIKILTGNHADTRLYTLFITGLSLHSSYEVSPLNSGILSVYRKEQTGLPTQDIGVCKHQKW